MTKSIGKRRSREAASDRPAKPYPEFPLYCHPLGYWSKKIRGAIRHFGRWGRVINGKLTSAESYEAGWQDALTKYKAQVDDLQAGRTPRVNDGALTVADLCSRFLTAKTRKMTAGEIGPRTFAEYRTMTDRLVKTFGGNRRVDDLAANDFEKLRADLAAQFGPVRLVNEIGRAKTVFKYVVDNGLLERPVRFGGEFKKPGKSVLRRHKATNGGNMMEAAEIRKLLDATANGVTFDRTNKKSKKVETVTWGPRPDLRAAQLDLLRGPRGVRIPETQSAAGDPGHESAIAGNRGKAISSRDEWIVQIPRMVAADDFPNSQPHRGMTEGSQPAVVVAEMSERGARVNVEQFAVD